MMIKMMAFLAASLSLLLAAGSSDGLERLAVEGTELHSSLVTRQLDNGTVRHVPRDVLHAIPEVSTNPEFVAAIARSGSQGNLGAEGIDAALYALYSAERDVGFYGLQAASADDADRLHKALGKIWSHNISIERARVHRGGLLLVVVWTDGVAPDVWEAVNAGVAKRLSATE